MKSNRKEGEKLLIYISIHSFSSFSLPLFYLLFILISFVPLILFIPFLFPFLFPIFLKLFFFLCTFLLCFFIILSTPFFLTAVRFILYSLFSFYRIFFYLSMSSSIFSIFLHNVSPWFFNKIIYFSLSRCTLHLFIYFDPFLCFFSIHSLLYFFFVVPCISPFFSCLFHSLYFSFSLFLLSLT